MLFTGCMIGPDFSRPKVAVSDTWLETRDPRINTASATYRKWWTAFNDPVLDRLVERAYQGSGLLLSWPLVLAPGERWSRTIRQTVTTTRDRALEEAGEGGLIGVPDAAADGVPLPTVPGATA